MTAITKAIRHKLATLTLADVALFLVRTLVVAAACVATGANASTITAFGIDKSSERFGREMYGAVKGRKARRTV